MAMVVLVFTVDLATVVPSLAPGTSNSIDTEGSSTSSFSSLNKITELNVTKISDWS